MQISFFRRAHSRINQLLLKIKTKKTIKSFRTIKPYKYNNITIRGYNNLDQKQISSIYSKLNNKPLSNYYKNLYYRYGDKLVFVAEDNHSGKIIGLDMFYFNQRDFIDGTIHEGFIGVLPEAEGQGTGTRLREAAIAYFSANNIQGISTRISKNNLKSFRSAKKLGFKVSEEYFDENSKETRYYLVLSLN